MKTVKASISRALNTGSRIVCADNTGAKIVQIISVAGYHGVKRRQAAAGVASMVKVTVKQGDSKSRHQIFPAVIIRQKKEYRRHDGMRIKFEDNAAVVLKDEKGNPKGTIFKGAIAKEACDRWPGVAKVANIIV